MVMVVVKDKNTLSSKINLLEEINEQKASKISKLCKGHAKEAYLIQDGEKVKKIYNFKGEEFLVPQVFNCRFCSSIYNLGGDSPYGKEYILRVEGDDEQAEELLFSIYKVLLRKD